MVRADVLAMLSCNRRGGYSRIPGGLDVADPRLDHGVLPGQLLAFPSIFV